MNDAIKSAFCRAAKVSPQYQAMDLYRQATSAETGRPMGRTYDFAESTRGAVRWPDFDQIARTYGGEVGDGIATLIAPGAVPDLIETADGEWLAVSGAEGQDTFGANMKVRVRRWTGDPPTIRNGPP